MWPIQDRRRLTHELKASKFLSFHILVASLVFNRSQQSSKEAEVTGGRGGGGEGRVEREIEEHGENIFGAMVWKRCLNYHV